MIQQPTECRPCHFPSSATFGGRPSVRPVGRPTVPKLETLEDRLVPSAVPDVFHVEPNYTLTVTTGLGVLINDDLPSNCVVSAVGGDTQAVGEEITLASGAKLTLDEDGAFVYTPHEQYTGVDEFNYTASNGSYWSTAWVSIVVLAEPEEELIEVEAIATRYEYEGDTVSFAVLAEGPDPEEILGYYATGLPEGVTINSATGVISGTISANTAQTLTPVTVSTVSVHDGTGHGSTTFLWAVGSAVTVIEPGTQSNLEGDEINAIAILAYSREEEALTLTVTGLPNGLSFDDETGFITGTLLSGTATSTGTTVTVTASDGTYSHTTTFVWKVGVLVGDQVSVEGDEVSLFLGDGGLSGTLSYSTTTLPDGLTLDEETGEISGTIEAGAAIDGLPVLITLTNGTDTVTQTFTWNVMSKYALWVNSIDSNGFYRREPEFSTALTFLGAVNTSVSLKLELTDPLGDAVSLGSMTYTATNLPDGLSLSTTANGVELTGTLTYAALLQGFEGTYAIAVTATDGVSSVTKNLLFVVIVAAADPTPVVVTVAAAEEGVQTLQFALKLIQLENVLTNDDLKLVLGRVSLRNLVRAQLNPIIREDPIVKPRLQFVLDRFKDDTQQEFVHILGMQGVKPAVKLTAAQMATVEMTIPKLGDDDVNVREAATLYLSGMAPRIYERLQQVEKTTTDANIRAHCRDFISIVDFSLSKEAALIADLKVSSNQNQLFDAKAFLLLISKGQAGAYLSIQAEKAFKAFP